jgi:hypothetical protein
VSEAEYTLAKDWLRADERVIWSYVQSGERAMHEAAPNKYRQLRITSAIIVGFFITFPIWSGDEQDRLQFLSIIGVIALAGLFSRYDCLPKIYDWFGRIFPSSVQTYFSCVVTESRVLLFSLSGDSPVSLPRSQLKRVWQDFAEGAPALMFRTDHPRRDYAFISTTDFTPALRVLKS